MRLCIVQFGERFIEMFFVMPHNKPDDLPFALRHISKGTLLCEYLRVVTQKRPVVFRQRTIEKALVKTHSAIGNVLLFKFTD